MENPTTTLKIAAASILVIGLAACQTSETPTDTMESAAADASTNPTEGSTVAPGSEGVVLPQETDPSAQAQQASAGTSASPQACTIQLAGGPPPKPARGADFGETVVKNTGKSVQRGIIQQIGGAIGGGLGAAVGGAVAGSTIRSEQDIKGIWMITDTSQSCACEIAIDSPFQLTGKGDNGGAKNYNCQSPALQKIHTWALGYSFTGYDAKFELKASDKKTVIATLNRDGIHYFAGTLADGTPVTMWREKQNYMDMKRRK